MEIDSFHHNLCKISVGENYKFMTFFTMNLATAQDSQLKIQNIFSPYPPIIIERFHGPFRLLNCLGRLGKGLKHS